MSDVRVGDAVRNNPLILDQRFTGQWSRKSIHFTEEIICKVLYFYTWFCGDLGITFEHRHTKSLRALIKLQNMVFFSFPPLFGWARNPQRNCKKQNLRFKSTTILEGSCTVLESVNNEWAVLLKAGFRKPQSCPVVMKLFEADALKGHLELASCTENSKTCKSYETYPLKDEDQCHIQQALLLFPSETKMPLILESCRKRSAEGRHEDRKWRFFHSIFHIAFRPMNIFCY